VTTASADRVAELFRLTEEESFVLVATKWWLMAQDRDLDPDAHDREAKAPVVLQYGLEVHRACQRELECSDDDLPPVEREALLERVQRPGWPPAVRRALGDAPFEEVESLFADWPFIAALLKSVTRRERAVLLTVELASFYPWPPDVLYEKDVRDEQLGAIVDALGAPVDRELLHELDSEIAARARRLAAQNVNWARLGLVAGGGAALSLLTAGLATPWATVAFAGVAGGSAAAAAAEAGDVLLGGNPLAAGGYDTAGVTFSSDSTADAGGSNRVLADLVKVDVLTDYYLAGDAAPELIRTVVTAADDKLARAEAELADLRRTVDELKVIAEFHEDAPAEKRDAAGRALDDAERARDYYSRELDNLRARMQATGQGADGRGVRKSRERTDLAPVNVMIAGQAGVGKSTLINAVLREPVADVGIGEPVTIHIQAHSVPGVPITVYDTPGLELGENVESVTQEFLDVIRDKRRLPATEHIHLLWFCIAAEGARIQRFEREFLRALSSEVPCVVVITQCLGEAEGRAIELSKSVADAIAEDRLDVVAGHPIKTLARSRDLGPYTIEPFGLDDLVEASHRVAMPQAVKQAFADAFAAVQDLRRSART
jgi:50S ribosome-binding GTPase